MVIESDKISFGVFDLQNSNQLLVHQIPLLRLEIQNGVIFNQTAMKRVFKAFFIENKLHNAFVAFALQGEAVQEELISFDTHGEVPFDRAKKIAPLKVWNFHFLPSSSPSKQKVYFFSLAREVILQYQLLALSIPVRCCFISSILRASLELMQSNESSECATLGELKQQATNVLKEMNISMPPMQKSVEEKQLAALHKGVFLLGKQVMNEKS